MAPRTRAQSSKWGRRRSESGRRSGNGRRSSIDNNCAWCRQLGETRQRPGWVPKIKRLTIQTVRREARAFLIALLLLLALLPIHRYLHDSLTLLSNAAIDVHRIHVGLPSRYAHLLLTARFDRMVSNVDTARPSSRLTTLDSPSGPRVNAG